MPHIDLPQGAPGLIGPLLRYPATGAPLAAFAQALMRGPSSLTELEREVLATHVSGLNACFFCAETHGATARHLLAADPDAADLTRGEDRRMRALLAIAGKVRESGTAVTAEDVALARAEGADDRAIHDTVLIAAAFCMFNRYVDGLATWTPTEPAAYERFGADLAEHGYRLGQPADPDALLNA